jgi:hypothetical protein
MKCTRLFVGNCRNHQVFFGLIFSRTWFIVCLLVFLHHKSHSPF